MSRFFFPCLKEVLYIERDLLPFLRANAVQRSGTEIILIAAVFPQEAGLAAGQDFFDGPLVARLAGVLLVHPETIEPVHQLLPVRFGKSIAVGLGQEFGLDLPMLVHADPFGQEVMEIGHLS